MQAELEFLAELADKAQITPLIDRSYPLEQTADAHAYVEQKHKKGNVVIVVKKRMEGPGMGAARSLQRCRVWGLTQSIFGNLPFPPRLYY
ncbi:MAG: hypothetical protein A3J97_11905 [Spirochaetes bacterium RIFOXYC1_FULL_54_7]|nr:MAG: hypothetical protein A3J97_11905 [Spirochaetes bacterium RIFOXYC1_FULL_54_7]